MIGIKTIASVLLLGLAAGLAASRGVVSVEHLASAGAWTCALIGLFASLSVALVSGAWQLDGPSHFGVKVSSRFGTIELPAWIQRVIYALVFVCVGLIAFGPRETALLASIPERLASASSQYCSDQEEDDLEPPAEPVELPAARGCALIRRAYELGYARTLGSCAPVIAETERRQRTLCTLRHRDEPYIHYAWRVARDRLATEKSADDAQLGSIEQLEIKLGYLDVLAASRWQAVNTAPRSAHHVWTNLPSPEDGAPDRDCALRYAPAGSRVEWTGLAEPSSALLDHALGQLLFNPKLGPVVGYCREHQIHWGAPLDACARLVARPASFLSDSGALDSVEQVLDRLRALRGLAELSEELGGKAPPPRPDATRVVSFHCYMVDAGGDGVVTTSALSLDGEGFDVAELVVPAVEAEGSEQLDVYEQLATLLSLGASTSALPTAVGERVSPESLAGSQFPLTRLELLARADPFAGTRWPLDRAELRELYPLDLFLGSFVGRFRKQYAARRGRL